MNSDVIILSNRKLTANMGDLHEEDKLIIRELRAEGLSAQVMAWEDALIEDIQAHGILFHTTWGYHRQISDFKKLLQKLQRSSCMVWNSIDQIRWNLHKKYLLELERSGCPVVPSKLIKSGESLNFHFLQEHFEAESLIFKPAIGASAENTFHLTMDITEDVLKKTIEPLRNQDVLVQPFLSGVVEEGEYSLIFIDGSLTHSILKQPREGDFRVQSEYGGRNTKCPTPPEALQVAHYVLECLQEEPLYARIDLIRSQENGFLLMELELIEPYLFFPFHEEAATRLAQAISKSL